TGCYVDTLNPVPSGTQVRIRLTRAREVFTTTAKVVYASPGLGMGIHFEDTLPAQLDILDRWLADVAVRKYSFPRSIPSECLPVKPGTAILLRYGFRQFVQACARPRGIALEHCRFVRPRADRYGQWSATRFRVSQRILAESAPHAVSGSAEAAVCFVRRRCQDNDSPRDANGCGAQRVE